MFQHQKLNPYRKHVHYWKEQHATLMIQVYQVRSPMLIIECKTVLVCKTATPFEVLLQDLQLYLLDTLCFGFSHSDRTNVFIPQALTSRY